MSEKKTAGTEAGQPRQRYDVPSLVRYGSLFAETGANTCSDMHADAGHNDNCDPDKGPVDGNTGNPL